MAATLATLTKRRQREQAHSLTSTQLRNAFPAWRVFIFGEDVSEDVTDVIINWNVGRAPNTCTITLNNELDKFIYTSNDLLNIYNDTTMRAVFQNIFNIDIVNEIIKQQVNLRINPIMKRRILNFKLTQRIKGVPAIDISGTMDTTVPAMIGDAMRYPLHAEDPIFHPNDPVRVFFRDPFNVRTWYHMFCGQCSNFDDNVDENNQKLLTITAEGPAKILRYARINTNPAAILDLKALATDYDAIVKSFHEGGFSGLTLPEILYIIIFGNDPENELTKFTVDRGLPGGTPKPGRFSGVGHFNLRNSKMVQFGPTSPGATTDPLKLNIPKTTVTNLSDYQTLIDHQVTLNDIIDMLDENATTQDKQNASDAITSVPQFSDGSPDVTAVIDQIGLNPDMYPVDGGRLIMLLPASLQPNVNREVLTRDLIASNSLNTEMRSRLSIIYDLMERIEFVFYESPKGDLIVEFPLYDFDPDDFGDFGDHYLVTKRDTHNFSRQVTDEKVRTQMACPWYPLQNWDQLGSTRELQAPVVVTLKHLIPLYGVRLEQVNPRGYIASPEAAGLYGNVVLNKVNADSRNMGINAVPNFGIWLNRPVYAEERNCVGTTVSVTHTIKWGMGGSVDTRYDLSYLRGWDGLISNDKPIFTPIGGMASRPLNYTVLFKLVNPQSSNNTVVPGQTKKTKSLKNGG